LLFLVHCCHCFTWSLNKTITFISILILICKYSSVRKVSVFSIAVRDEDTLKQTRLYDSHLNNITAVIPTWNYPSQATMKTSLVLCFCQRWLVQPTQLHSFWIEHTIIILIFIYTFYKKKKSYFILFCVILKYCCMVCIVQLSCDVKTEIYM